MFRTKKFALLLAICAIGIAQAWATQVTFQVNMNVQAELGNFTLATDSVFIRGNLQDPPNQWSGYTHRLADGDADGIYTGTFDLAPLDTAYSYKFVLVHNGTDGWEADPNRTVLVTNEPAILPVVFFSNLESSTTADVEIYFRVDMRVQLLNGNFDPTTDWIVIRGSHDDLGPWGGAEAQMTPDGENPGVYYLWKQFTGLSTVAPLEYKFVICHDFNENDQTGWEGVTGGGNRMILPTGDEPDILPPPSGNGFGEISPDLVFWGDISMEGIISQAVAVTFQVEITPLLGKLEDVGYVTDVQVNTDTVRTVEDIQIAGATPPLIWAWTNIQPEFFLNDNGTGGDLVAGDDVWSVTVTFPAGTSRIVEYKYGCNQYDVEASSGGTYNHFRTIDDSQPTNRFDIDCWGSTDVLYANWPCVISDVDDNPAPVISEFSLEQNFPNPFNPTTTISFTLSRADMTTLKVFDVLGRNAATVDLGRMDAGRHTVTFDGSNLSSGVYFYQVESGVANATRKMLLLK